MSLPAPLAIRAGASVVELAPEVGGAIVAWRHDARDVLRPTSDAMRAAGTVRGHACYPLVPYSNRIAQARLRVGPREYALARNFGDHPHAIHGVGWQRAWHVDETAQAAVALSLDHDPAGDGARAWPFAFRAIQRIALACDGDRCALTLSLSIENRDREPFPFGLGWHPFFPRSPRTTLGFRATGAWRADATRIPVEHARLGREESFDPPRRVDELALDDVFTGWDGRATIGQPDEPRSVVIEADRALTHLVVFVPEGRDYLAVEPVTHMTDAFNRAALGQQDTGTRVLPPGASFSCTMRLTVDGASGPDSR